MSSVWTPRATSIDIADLPTSPQLVFQLLDACETNDCSMADVANLIRLDAALASRVLALAANPVYAQYLAGRPADLERSLMLLGPNTVRTLALTTAVYQHIGGSLAAHADLLRRLWRESLLTAALTERLAALSGYGPSGEAYLAGLLSNIGQIGLLARAPADYASLIGQAHGAPDDLLQREAAVFGVDHATLGATMLHKAGRTGPLTDAVHYHHASADSLTNAHHLVRLVALANRLVATGHTADATELVEDDRLPGLTPGLVDEAYAAAAERTGRVSREFGLASEALQFPQAAAADRSPLGQRLSELQLISAIRRQFADGDDLEEVCKASHLAISLLFGIQAVGFVLMQKNTAKAVGHSAIDASGNWAEFVLRLPDERSRVGAALSTGTPQEYYPWRDARTDDAASPAVVDLEFTALLKREGFLALPLNFKGKREGVILIGVDPEDATRLAARRTLLNLFSRELGNAIAEIALRTEQRTSALADQAAEFRLRTRSVAHEVRNPLSIIQNHLHILGKRAFADSAYPANDIRIMDEEISRVGALVGTLADAVDQDGRNETTHVNELIEDVINLIKPPLITPAQIELELSLDASIPEIAVPRDSVKQILVNLIKNAAEALNAGQSISIHTEDYVYNGKTPYVGIGVADDGPGIPPQVLAAIFEPITSGKGKGHSGLGLSITKRLVDSLDGHITCRSSARGTRFQVLLPRVLPGVRDAGAAASASSPDRLRGYA